MDAELLDAMVDAIATALDVAGRREPASVEPGERLLARLLEHGSVSDEARQRLVTAISALAGGFADADGRHALRAAIAETSSTAGGAGIETDMLRLLGADGGAARVTASGEGAVAVGFNAGIISTGRDARNTIVNLPSGGLRAADEVACPPGVAEFGPYPAGRLFVGREDELAAVETALARGARVIATGLGGVGKSALARRYAETRRGHYDLIWWIDAEDAAGIETGLAALARRLYPDLAALSDPDAAAWARAWLGGHRRWLVVLDNAPGPGGLADLLGSAPEEGAGGGGHFLLTSRLAAGWEQWAELVPLDVLPSGQAQDLLARAVGRTEPLDGGAQLCEALGYLPLAVRMAAAYLRENAVTAEVYLARLREPGGDVLAWTPTAGDPERTVARIWQVSLRRLTEEYGFGPEFLLQVMAWLAPTGIPVSMLYNFASHAQGVVDESVSRLAAYGLVTRQDDALAVHRLVQAAARYADASRPDAVASVDSARGIAVDVMREALPPSDDPDGARLWRRVVPHVEAHAALLGPQITDPDTLDLFNAAAYILFGQGQPARGVALLERTASATIARLGPEHPDALAFRAGLARGYFEAGDLDRAIPLLEQALADVERALGSDHLESLTARFNLGTVYEKAGDHGRAITALEQNLAEGERVLARDHPNIIDYRFRLALAYLSAEDDRRAMELFERALLDSERILGRDDPRTAAIREAISILTEDE